MLQMRLWSFNISFLKPPRVKRALINLTKEMQEIIDHEKDLMVIGQPTERHFTELQPGAIKDGVWQTGWCTDTELIDNKLIYNLPVNKKGR